MAKNKGWWDLELKENRMDDLSDCDREHIAKCIIGGCTSGEIIKDKEFYSGDDEIYPDEDQIEILIKPKE